MANRTATYNSTSLGDYLCPIKDGDLDTGDYIEFGLLIKPIFESSTPSTRYMGARTKRVTLRFAKDSAVSGSSYNTDEKLNRYFDSLASSFTPLVGSTTGASLVITDGSTSRTYANAMIEKMEKISNICGLMKVEVTFICRNLTT